MERRWIRKSGSIKSTKLRSTGRLNAILSMCRVMRIAHYFFEFSVAALGDWTSVSAFADALWALGRVCAFCNADAVAFGVDTF